MLIAHQIYNLFLQISIGPYSTRFGTFIFIGFDVVCSFLAIVYKNSEKLKVLLDFKAIKFGGEPSDIYQRK